LGARVGLWKQGEGQKSVVSINDELQI
jgi:hypothetical protein